MRVALVMRSLALLVCATVSSACGTDKDALSCAEIGRRLGELQIIERYGSVSGFMTERERQRKIAPWIERCEDVAPSSAERRCILEASDLSTATACATGLALPSRVEEPVADAPFKTRWGGRLGGPGHDSIDAITFARDGDVIAAGSFDQDLSLGADTLTSQEPDVWVTRLSSDGTVRWSRRLGGDDTDRVRGVAVGDDGAVVLAMDSAGEVDYGAGLGYLGAARDKRSRAAPMVLVTLAEEGGWSPTAHALAIGGAAESIAALDDGGLVVGARASGATKRGRKGDPGCPAGSFVVARLARGAAVEWIRCNDPKPGTRFTKVGGEARVTVAPGGAVAFCAGFEGDLAWAGQTSPPSAGDVAPRAFVALLDPAGEVRWVRYASGGVGCRGLSAAGDGSVAALLDGASPLARVALADGRSTSGPALAVWDETGTLRWSRTCSDLLGQDGCIITAVVGLADELVVAATWGAATIVAALAVSDGAETRSRFIVEGASLDHLAAGPDSIVYGATFKGAADLGNGRYESLDSYDILIGAFAR